MIDDTDFSQYTIAFRNDEYLMVYNPKRNGWEMPGGHIKLQEPQDDGAKREFIEESGYEVKIVGSMKKDTCTVFAGIVEKQLSGGEMKSKFFSSLPEQLQFPSEEYKENIVWAFNLVKKHRYASQNTK